MSEGTKVGTFMHSYQNFEVSGASNVGEYPVILLEIFKVAMFRHSLLMLWFNQ